MSEREVETVEVVTTSNRVEVGVGVHAINLHRDARGRNGLRRAGMAMRNGGEGRWWAERREIASGQTRPTR